MTDTVDNDLFAGFQTQTIETGEAGIFLRTGGSGPPLLLLHGFPQTHAMWHRVARALAEDFTLVIPDLRGYGRSSIPADAPNHQTFSKRAMASDMVAIMAQLGFPEFNLAGHDRGGRVAYRLALDHPQSVSRVAVLDIVPTLTMWAGMDAALAMTVYHWMFLAQPPPLPERLIAADPVYYLDHTIASWTATGDLSAMDERALSDYRECFNNPERIHAACEDYRAGQTFDLSADRDDFEARRRISCPLLALWGDHGIPSETENPLATWRQWADDVVGHGIASGHFVCEENPVEVAASLARFFKG